MIHGICSKHYETIETLDREVVRDYLYRHWTCDIELSWTEPKDADIVGTVGDEVRTSYHE